MSSIFEWLGPRKCYYCANLDHGNTLCPRIKAITFYPDGTTQHVELWPEQGSWPWIIPPVTSAAGETKP